MNDVQKFILNRAIQKTAASPISDALVGGASNVILSSLIPGAAPVVNVANAAGYLGGLFQDPMTEEQREDMNQNDHWAKSIIPGVAGYKIQRRRRAIAKELGGGMGLEKPLSEQIGPLTSSIISVLLGAAGGGVIGANIDDVDKVGGTLEGTMMGAAAGLGAVGVSHLVGTIAAAIRKRRTKQEQQEYETDTGATVANYLVPGLTTYNSYKNLGYMQGEYEEQKARRSSGKENKKDKDTK